jgi:hypothetical protein
MPIDVGNFDPLTVSLRDYIDGFNNAHEDVHALERSAVDRVLEFQKNYSETVISDHFRTHDKEHEQVKVAFDNYLRQLELSRDAHGDLHQRDQEAVKVALESVSRMAQVHTENHTKEHGSHELVHQREREAGALARAELDVRLSELSDYRAQLREQTSTFMSRNEISATFERVNSAMATLSAAAEASHQRMDRSSSGSNIAFQSQIDKLNLAAAADSGATQRTTVLIGLGFTVVTILVAIAGIYLGSKG